MSAPETDPSAAPAAGRRLTVRLSCLLVMVVTAGLSLLLRWQVPVTLLPGSGYDDALFIRQARNLTFGHWLGPFDQLTLSKGPAYPAFIAAMHALRIPLKMGEQLTLLLAALALAACVWVLTRRPVVSTAVFVVVALDPASFGLAASRVLRDSWYASLSLLLIATFFLAVHAAVTRTKAVWAALLGILAGAVLAATWLCREEGAAILPPLVVIAVLVPLWALLRGRRARTPGPVRGRRTRVKALRLAGVLALTGVAALAPVAYVMHQNDQHYGAALTNDVAAGAFGRAYADWSGVTAGPHRALVPISAAQRAAVYAVSPAAAELAPVLEDPGNSWGISSCNKGGICDDYGGGWEVWALRGAAAKAGHFTSEAAVQDYFGRVSREIESACSSGRLRCDPRVPPSLEPLQHATVGGVLASTWHGLVFISAATSPTQPAGPLVDVPFEQRRSFASMIDRLPTSDRSAQVQEARFVAHASFYRWLSDIYQWLLLALLATGLAGFVMRLIRGKHVGPPGGRGRVVVLLGAGLAVGTFSRLLLLAVIDSTTFGAVRSSYELSTRMMLLGGALVGTAALCDAAGDRLEQSRAERAEVSPSAPGSS